MDIMSSLDPKLALGLGGMEIIAQLVLVYKINFSTQLHTLTGSVISPLSPVSLAAALKTEASDDLLQMLEEAYQCLRWKSFP